MKPKISPEDYRRILESLDLDTINIVEVNSKLREEFVSSSLQLFIDDKYTFEQDKTVLRVYFSYKLTAKDDSKADNAFVIYTKYLVKYKINKDVSISKEFMKVFSELTLGMLLWPFFRELINNTIYRMGMPPLILPLKVR